MNQNPYTPSFGKSPIVLIPRLKARKTILDVFSREPATQNAYMIVGVRGSGKTVFMAEVAEEIEKEDNWVVVRISPNSDILTAIVSKLSNHDRMRALLNNAKINLSFFGFGIEIKGADPITDLEVALTKILEKMKKEKKRLLITIDEVTNTPAMREFASVFQILLSQNLPVFLLATGLFENINNLRNVKNLTFLYRMPRIEMTPLNMETIAEHYQEIFSLDTSKAREMASLTKGYSYAFQTLGDLTWNKSGDFLAVQSEYRQQLEEYVYEKIWDELSDKDRELAYAVAKSETGKVKEIRAILGCDTNQFNPYSDRLKKRGILDGRRYGYLRFTLPYFERFAESAYEGVLF